MLKEFPRDFSALSEIFEFTQAFFEARELDKTHLERINFAIEELFTNMVKYSKDGQRPIRIGPQSLLHWSHWREWQSGLQRSYPSRLSVCRS